MKQSFRQRAFPNTHRTLVPLLVPLLVHTSVHTLESTGPQHLCAQHIVHTLNKARAPARVAS